MKKAVADSLVVALLLLVTAVPCQAITYYVNDTSTVGDVYTSGIGNDNNWSICTNRATPMRLVSSCLASNDLEPGDAVFIDTGRYDGAVVVDAGDSGSGGVFVTYQGSTNYAYGGSLIRTEFLSTPWTLISAQYVHLKDLVLEGPGYSLDVSANASIIERIVIAGSIYALYHRSGNNNRYQGCTLYNNNTGFYFDLGVSNSLDRMVFVDNVNNMYTAVRVSVSNSVMVGGALNPRPSFLSGDYNVLWNVSLGVDSLATYQREANAFTHSIMANPQITSTNQQYYLQSRTGRFNPAGGWFTDVVHSVAIDFGALGAPFNNEPMPNGGRMNAGAQGNYSDASLSRTSAWLLAVSYNDGGMLAGTSNALYWNAGQFTNRSTVKVQYSGVYGEAWNDLATSIPATNGYYRWDVSGMSPTAGFWRVVSEADPAVSDASDQRVSINGFKVPYFVNPVGAGDVYCTASGSDTNAGIAPYAPMLTLTNMLDVYDFSGADIVFMDTGTNSGSSVTISGSDAGSSDGWFEIQGSTNYTAGGTMILASGSYGVRINSSFVKCSHLSVFGSTAEVSINGSGNRMERVQALYGSYGFLNISGSNNYYAGCVAYNNTYGHYVQNGSHLAWDYGISYMCGTAFLNPVALAISNSVVVGGAAFQSGWPASGDYNMFHNVTWPAGVGSLNAAQKFLGGWWRSTWMDPQFYGPAQFDFHPRSSAGRFDQATGAWIYTDTVDSPLVDFGDPAAAYGLEPAPNGSNVNIGIHGNASDASKSRTNAWLLTLTYNDGGTLEVPGDYIYWSAHNFPTNATVRIELSLDNGSTWGWAATNIAAAAGAYAWAATNFTTSADARWRVVYESNTNIFDANNTNFFFHNGPFVYYLNDASTNGDVYTSNPGSDAYTGTSPGSPKYSLYALINSRDLVAGDVIYVDTGEYTLNSNSVFSLLDRGTNGLPIHVYGSTNSWQGGSVFNRGNGAANAYAIEINGGEYIELKNITLKNAGVGLWMNNAQGIVVERVVCTRNDLAGLHALNSSNIMIRHSVFWNNTNAGVRVDSGMVAISNSVVAATGPAAYGYFAATETSIVGDYNDLYATNQALVGFLSNLGRPADTHAAWAGLTGNELHSLSVNPLFANPDGGDFHLRTATPNGRYVPGVGFSASDSETSLLIDSGDPAAPFTWEPLPNGDRVNIGLFGNTPEASKGRTNAWLYAALPQNGGWLAATGAFHWVAGGPAKEHTVRLDYSPDGGYTWSTLASGLAASNEIFRWNTTITNNTPAGMWKVISQTASAISNQVSQFFGVRNSPLTIFLNNGQTNGDVYCSGPGAATNWLATSNRPLNSLVVALQRYDLEPGDRVLVDTGIYTNDTHVEIARLDGGSTGAAVTVNGSFNEAAGGSVLYRTSSASNSWGLYLYHADALSISNLEIRNSYVGIYAQGASRSELGTLKSLGQAAHGMYIGSCSNIVVRRCLLASNAGRGLFLSTNVGMLVQQSVIWSNRGGAVYQAAGQLAIYNSLLNADGLQQYIYEVEGSAATLAANYNDLLAYNEAQPASFKGQVAKTVFQWQTQYTNDVMSLSHAPAFAGPSQGDFHLQTTVVSGRYVAGRGYVTNDAVNSPLIDTGDPGAAFGLEPEPNGGRLNIGLFGNTTQASKSRTNGWFLALTCNDGGVMRGSNTIYWVAGGVATGHQVFLQYSMDGSTWVTFVSNLSASARSYLWDTTAGGVPVFLPQAYWRVVSTLNGALADAVDNSFVINNGSLVFYVNDGSRTNDLYCTAIGSESNDGLSSNSPKARLEQVFSAYTPRPGDIIYVDTGVYTQSVEVTIQQVTGAATNRLLLQGSLNGSVIHAAGVATALRIDLSEQVEVRNLTLRGATTAFMVSASSNVVFDNVSALGCAYGFMLNGVASNVFRHCVAAQGGYGLYLAGAFNTSWERGVMWSNTYGVYMASGSTNFTFLHSAVVAYGPGRYAYYFAGQPGLISADYNEIYLQDSAYAGYLKGVIYPTLSRWARDNNLDRHSLSKAPGFADPAAGDFHLKTQYPAGRYVVGVGYAATDPVTSVLLDAGDPAAAYGNEPAPNGARINIGQYGNSSQASKTPTNGWLTVISLNDGGRIEGTNYLYWAAGGAATDDVVTIRFSWDAGAHWANLVTNLPAGTNRFLWDTTKYPSTALGRWYIFSEQAPGIFSMNDQLFAVRNSNLYFYVNDGITNGDVYCNATGQVSNTGCAPGAPKADIQDLLDTYDIEAGDVVYVDTGAYSPTGAVAIGQFDCGAGGRDVVIQGSTNAVAGGTVLGDYGLDVQAAQNVAIHSIAVTGASFGVKFTGCVSSRVERVRVFQCQYGVICADRSVEITVLNTVLWGGSYGLYVSDNSASILVEHAVLWSNVTAVGIQSGSVTVNNSVIGVFGSGRYAYSLSSAGFALSADYNNMQLLGGAVAGIRQTAVGVAYYNTLARWAIETGNDRHSLSVDPGWADASARDFHLLSQYPAGRYVDGVGFSATDMVASLLLDAGTGGYLNEPVPNGMRANIGLYGNTTEASKSSTNAALAVITLNDGGWVAGAADLYWVAYGDATGYTVNVQYSSDGGATWQDIAMGVPAGQGMINWTSTLFESSALGRWRVIDLSSGILATNSQVFALRNTPLKFYVNDGVTNGDVYCTATGSIWNTGAAQGSPKASVQDVLDTYDLEPADTVYVDTGLFPLDSPIIIGTFDAGSFSNQVAFQGSTNYAAGGTVVSNQGILVIDAGGVALRDFSVVRAAGTACEFTGTSTNGSVSRFNAWLCGTGFKFTTPANRATLANCSALECSIGLQVVGATGVRWWNGVLWSNYYGLYMNSGGAEVRNTIIGAYGMDRYAYYLGIANVAITSDYNNVLLGNGAYAAYMPTPPQSTIYQTLSRWAWASGQDTHSLSRDPLFVAAGTDFHLRSRAGHYQPGYGFTNDTVSSPLLDAGDPHFAYTNEPEPNGNRINIGLYGGVNEASKTATNAGLTVVSFNDGGYLRGVTNLYWIPHGVATAHTVRLDYSSDGGVMWTNIATNVSACSGAYLWDTTLYPSTIRGYWRVTSEQSTDVGDQNAVAFALRNLPLHFYVNDSYTNGDIYCTRIGNATNLGVQADQPASSIKTILDNYDLEPGDVIFVDTGDYLLSQEIAFNRFDGGESNNWVTVMGSSNEVAYGSAFTKFGSGYAFYIDRTPGIRMCNLTIKNAGAAVRMNQADYARMEWVRVRDGVSGFEIYDSDFVTLEHCVALGNSTGVRSENSQYVSWNNGVLWSNAAGVYMANSRVSVYNSILGAVSRYSSAYFLTSDAMLPYLAADYNDIYIANGGVAASILGGSIGGGTTRYTTVFGWATLSGKDTHTLSVNPLFADEPNADFHLKSVQGRYDILLGWQSNDVASSFAIDAGDPTRPYQEELVPNGGRLNIGLYGNHWQASKSPTNGQLAIISLNDGGSVSGTVTLAWLAIGTATSGLVRIEYSGDGGEEYVTLADVAASDGLYFWDSVPYGSSALALWRVTSLTDPALTDTSDSYFYLRNSGGIRFFVNDDSLIGDVYTKAVGLPANRGVSSNSPKSSIQGVLDVYDLEGGDIIYVDTGTYRLGSDLEFGDLDAGNADRYVVVQGSYNEAFGGSVLDRQVTVGGTSICAVVFLQTGYVEMRDMNVTRAGIGVNIVQSPNCRFDRVVSRANTVDGFQITKASQVNFANCQASDNGRSGLALAMEAGCTWDAGVIWGNPFAVYVAVGSAVVKNSLLGVSGSGTRIYKIGLAGEVSADFNNILRADGAYVADRPRALGGTDLYDTLTSWNIRYGQDRHSLSHEPLLPVPLGSDFHPASQVGRYLVGYGWTNDAQTSPMIDTGDPTSVFTNEPSPNGGRINIGSYGNHPEGSKSLSNAWLLAVSFNDGGTVYGTNYVYWTYGNITNTATVDLEFSNDGGIEYDYPIALGVSITANLYACDFTALPQTALGRWRVVCSSYALTDAVDRVFSVRNEPRDYYVNDDSTVGDVYCSAKGSPTNWDATAEAPLDDVVTLFAMQPIAAGDTIYIDTGVYTNTAAWSFTDLIFGEEGWPINVLGSTNYAYGGSLFDHGNTNTTCSDGLVYGLILNNTRNVVIQHLRFTRAAGGVQVSGAENIDLSWIQAYNNCSHGFYIAGRNVALQHCAGWNNRGYGLYTVMGPVTWDHGVIWSNDAGGLALLGGPTTINNSIVSADGPNSYLSVEAQGVAVVMDYNVLWPLNGAGFGYNIFSHTKYLKLFEWQRLLGRDIHSVLSDPLFYDAPGGDFHVLSSAGRYQNGAWIPDSQTSWAIDAGQWTAAYSNEPLPNGERANAGMYGNTTEASKTPTNPPTVFAATLRDGGMIQGTVPLYWLSHGLSTTDTVCLDYSYDGGLTWTSIVCGLSVTQDVYYWDTTQFPSSPQGLWRVGNGTNQPPIMDQTTNGFFLRTGPINFYVNNTNTDGDVYCSQPGSITNNGLNGASPLPSVSDVLGRYDLDPGDRVYIDTGIYEITNGWRFTSVDGGSAVSNVYLIGSTNLGAGGTIVDCSHSNVSEGISIRVAGYFEFSHLTIQKAPVAVYLNGAEHNIFRQCLFRDNGSGAFLDMGSSDNLFDHCIVTRSSGVGINLTSSHGTRLLNCVVWSNGTHAVYLKSCGVAITNSVLAAHGANNLCISIFVNPLTGLADGGPVYADYNDYYVSGGAYYARLLGSVAEGLPQWVANTTQDIHTLSIDPGFASPTNDDFHPLSASGRFDPLVGDYVMTDTNYAPLIDLGDPGMVYTNEPEPNGSRMNIGAYGNTGAASKSQTNRWLMVVTGNSGGLLNGIFWLVWGGGGMAPSNEVKLSYSWDNGNTWTNIATDPPNITLGEGQYLWNSAQQLSGVEVYPSSPNARWRISLAADPTVYDITDTFFALRNKPFVFYINDTSTVHDVYTSAVGSDINLGLFANAPKATLQSLLDTLDVEGGDTILIDTGTYPVTNVFGTVTDSDSGRAGQPVYIRGSTNVFGSTLHQFEGTTAIQLSGDYIDLRCLNFNSGALVIDGNDVTAASLVFSNASLSASGGGPLAPGIRNLQIEDVRTYAGNVAFMRVEDSVLRRATLCHGGISVLNNSANVTLENALVYGTITPAISIVGNSAGMVVRNCTLAASGTQYYQSGDVSSKLENNIMIASGKDNFCINMAGGTIDSDYNDLIARNNAWIGSYNGNWERLTYWQQESGQDLHSMAVDPAFLNEAGANYHLKSTQGHYPFGPTDTDTVSSVCIDAGNVYSTWTNEPSPNGSRVNLGAYGNTREASKTPISYGAALIALTANDGGVLRGTNITLVWLARELTPSDTVRLEYSFDNGGSWAVISSNVSATAAGYTWNSLPFTSSLEARWRVVLESNTAILGMVSNSFALRNTALPFYVNDLSTANDVYTGAIGSDSNTGLTPGSPMLSLASLLNRYGIVGPDVIYVDTGIYAVTSNWEVIWSKRGSATDGPLTIKGSTNYAAGGSILNRGNAAVITTRGLHVYADYVWIQDVDVREAYYGILWDGALFGQSRGVVAVSNAVGLRAVDCVSPVIQNGRFWNNTAGGVDVQSCATAVVQNCTFMYNSNYAVRLQNSSFGTIQNNIFVATGATMAALSGGLDAAFVDYNIYWFDGSPAAIYSGYTTLLPWQLAKSHDFRSAITNPMFASTTAPDFHLRSAYGRYVDATRSWVTDASTSWGVDRGNPASVYTNEPGPSGNRINIGAYGNTPFASKGATGAVVEVRTLNNGGSTTNYQQLLSWSVRNIETTRYFRVQFSGDGGASWVDLNSNVWAYQEYLLFNPTPYYNTFQGFWRVLDDTSPYYVASNNLPFQMFFGEFAISQVGQNSNQCGVVWRGAWNETYQVQYATNSIVFANSWTNASDGVGSNQRARFLTTQGGDFTYEDPNSSNSEYRLYRVIWVE